MIVSPLAKEVLQGSYNNNNILGVDGTHMKNYYVTSGQSDITMQSKMTLTVFTTRNVGKMLDLSRNRGSS